MNLLVIGHSVEDHINYLGKTAKMKPGGIFYSVSGLNAFKNKEDEIYLATAVSKKNYFLFESVYKELNQKYFSWVEEIPSIHLSVYDDKERHEKYSNITDKLELDFSELNSFDGILINMITGFDISLDDIEKLRENYQGKIYLDIHSLARGIDEGFVRKFRKIPEFHRWAKSVDIIQANENEIQTLSSLTDEIKIAEEILSYGVKVFVVTKGEIGCSAYVMGTKGIIGLEKKALKVPIVNRVGCGDIFGAVFFYSLLKDNDIDKSLNLANIAGACISNYNDVNLILNLKRDVFSRLN
jgi:hypothetical protein